ncbi:MAG: AtpZ/AtpI family protein [Candidatus Gottesmanbacteria bacterium]|nr:AtpZ/AtpI family protein [Candidatus Gottesmanbacteria bacterium]
MVEQYDITLNTGFRGAKNRPKRRNKESDNAWYYLGLAGQIGYIVAIPIAGGAILGSLVDHRFGIYPKGSLIGIVTGFVISTAGFVHVIREIIQKRK